MSKAKERHPGAFYHVARRCDRREFRLRPDQELVAAIAVLVSDACDKTGLQVIAIVWMSDHCHVILYNPYNTSRTSSVTFTQRSPATATPAA